MPPRLRAKGQENRPIGEVVLHFLEGENEGVEIRVNAPREMTIGRSEECDIFLGEKKISRKHCLLSVTNEYVRLSDLQSTNGTFVNTKKINEVTLENNDKVRIGNSVIQVSLVAQEAGAVAPEPPKAQTVEPEEPSGVLSIEADGSLSAGRPEALAEVEPSPLEIPDVFSEPKAKPLAGNLSAMGLADLLQNLSQNRKSGILRLSSSREGKIWIHEGKVAAAEVGQARGDKALFRMLGWNEGEFELLPLPDGFDPANVEVPIADSVEHLLMEGFRQFDELQKIRKGLPELTARLKLRPKFTSPLSKLHPRVLDVLQVILNEEIFETVLDLSPISDLETAKVVFYLIKKKYITAE